MSKPRDKRLLHPYTPDVAGLAALVARRLERGKRDEIKMEDVKTAKTLDITVERLTQLQGELRASGMFFCRQATSTSRYGRHPIQGQTVRFEW
jgi:hypothetical protein